MRPVEPQAAEPADAGAVRPAPGPSKLSYRLARAWAKPGVRALVTVYLPLTFLGLVGWRLAADDQIREGAEARLAAAWERVAQRPEFLVRGIRVTGANEVLAGVVEETVALPSGSSLLRLDLDLIRQSVEALGPVRTARVRLDPRGILRVHVTQRRAVALWRNEAGGLVTIDGEGVIIGVAARRDERPTLPLVLGDGARAAVTEALALLDAAPTLRPRVRALVRVGRRRWDMVLDRDMIVMLPEAAPVDALAGILARAEGGGSLFDRTLAAVDLRLAERPTLRLTAEGMETYRLNQVTAAEAGEET